MNKDFVYKILDLQVYSLKDPFNVAFHASGFERKMMTDIVKSLFESNNTDRLSLNYVNFYAELNSQGILLPFVSLFAITLFKIMVDISTF